MPRLLLLLPLSLLLAQPAWDPACYPIRVPKLTAVPRIDGDLGDWKDVAHSDGLWDILRLRQMPWFDPRINRLTDHGNEPSAGQDLQARYYIAWDDQYLYFGAEVRDNVNDTRDPQHEPKRWYYKDAICWFVEAPRDNVPEKFGQGDNAFCYVIDAARPPYGAWWRHGAPGKTYVEAPLKATDYALRMNPWKRSAADFVLEARVRMDKTFAISDPGWRRPKIGDNYGLEIVHTDPDGGAYGGHLILYGHGDDDATWGRLTLAGPLPPVERKPN
ncbi:MAG: sugar-binding protein [Bryobacteraceae bacterium]